MRFLKPTRLRLYSQIFCFALFLLLLFRTEFRGALSSSAQDIRLPYPVGLFFRLDPLVAISNALASHALYKGLLVSVVVLIPTLFFGRFFCGWICPLGSITSSEASNRNASAASNGWTRTATTDGRTPSTTC